MHSCCTTTGYSRHRVAYIPAAKQSLHVQTTSLPWPSTTSKCNVFREIHWTRQQGKNSSKELFAQVSSRNQSTGRRYHTKAHRKYNWSCQTALAASHRGTEHACLGRLAISHRDRACMCRQTCCLPYRDRARMIRQTCYLPHGPSAHV